MLRRAIRFGLPPTLAGLLMLAVWVVLGVPPARAEAAAPVIDTSSATAVSGVTYTIALSQVTTGIIVSPVYLMHAGDGSGRLFVVDQTGKIRVIKNGTLLATPYLTLTSLVESDGSEQGLLSVAFDPDYESNGTFYVNYTAQSPNGDTVIARYVVSNPASDSPTVSSVTILLTIDQPQSNHNGGQLQFGPNDDYLYIGMGDGGSSGDSGSGHHEPGGNAQWGGTLLGKLLRVNVRGVPTYTIPATNPFTQTAGYKPEIWALGLRNPWRFSFDRLAGDLYIGDVGQNEYEEVDYRPASSAGGENYGWRCKEGFHDYDTGDNCPSLTPVPPVAEYDHGLGSAVTGGYAYRGSDYPWLSGIYFYADYGSGRIWSLEQTSPGVWVSTQRRDETFSISSFGEDEQGELYVLDYFSGRVLKITSTASPDLSPSAKWVSSAAPTSGQVVTFTLALRNAGGAIAQTVRLTDTLPAGLTYKPGTLTATLGTVDASAAPVLKWNGVPSSTPAITVTYAVTVSAATTQTISNTVTIAPGFSAPFTRTALIIVNGLRIYLPIVLKE